MTNMNEKEIENVAGAFPVGALPLIIVAFPTRPMPQPSNEPVIAD